MKDLTIHVLFRFSKKTGNIDMTMTSLGSAQMKLWALSNTPKTKGTAIIEQETGNVVFLAIGTKDGFPKVKENIGSCEKIGIPIEFVQSIEDDRFQEVKI